MKIIILGIAALLGASVTSGPAAGWASANRYGGSTTHSYGETSHTNAHGGSTSHAYGEGTEHTNAYGGTTAHGWDGGTTHTNVYGGTTTGAVGVGVAHTSATGYTTAATAYHPPYPTAVAYAPYHPPVAVPYYSSGCYNCGSAAAAGAVVGLAAGAAIASANTATATSNAYAAGVATGSANTAARYSSGYAAGTANVALAPTTTTTVYAMGVNYATVPTGSISINKNGSTYYLNGNTWFQPAFGANGVYYTVVATP